MCGYRLEPAAGGGRALVGHLLRGDSGRPVRAQRRCVDRLSGFGEGPDHVLIRLWMGDLGSMWDQPLLARYFTRMAEFSRIIIFDKRGTGMSDRARAVPTLEARMDDVRAVMDAAGSERAVLSGGGEGAQMEALFAATYPERVSVSRS
jgi:pimeloyl-ACP methyl ester carboxylesterase